MRAWHGGSSWPPLRLDTARRSCSRTGPGAASTRSPGSRWTRGTTTRPGSGATRWRRWTGLVRDRRTAGPLLGPPAPTSFQGLVTALINDLAGEEALLVLDDYHVISAQQVHESLSFLVEHRPAGICVVLASRSDPPLALARLRARGLLSEMRAAELRFTPAEAGELLRHAASALPGWFGGGAGGPDRGLGGRAGSWPRCHCADMTMPPGSWPRSPAATGMSWTTWPRRCSSGRTSSCGRSCSRPRCWTGSAARCATPSPAARAARRCWSRPNGPGCS